MYSVEVIRIKEGTESLLPEYGIALVDTNFVIARKFIDRNYAITWIKWYNKKRGKTILNLKLGSIKKKKEQ